LFLFAFTNGFLATQCAIKSPSRAPEDSKEVVGSFVSVFITLGIVVGSLVALATAGLIKGNIKCKKYFCNSISFYIILAFWHSIIPLIIIFYSSFHILNRFNSWIHYHEIQWRYK
jgi:ABC-type glycerol-3-phosphate transport system permease component